MPRAKRTDGYGERLMRALEEGPRPMSLRGLGNLMEGAYPDLRGATYSGVRQYAEGNIKVRPRVDLLRAIAEVLQVRWQWLAYGNGEMTASREELRVERAAAAAATSLETHLAFILKDAVVGAFGTENYSSGRTDQIPYWVAPLGEVWMQLLDSPGPTKEPEAMIGAALLAPLRAFGVDPVALAEEGNGMGHYVLAMLPALLLAAAERRRQMRRRAADEADEAE
jgi:hypothetical protein